MTVVKEKWKQKLIYRPHVQGGFAAVGFHPRTMYIQCGMSARLYAGKGFSCAQSHTCVVLQLCEHTRARHIERATSKLFVRQDYLRNIALKKAFLLMLASIE